MSVRLLVRQRGEAGGADKPTEVLLNEDSITLGRDTACQVVLAQQAVSRSHARISRDGALFFLEDLGSSYGTEVNGERLPKGEKRLLRNGDIIAIAQFDLTFDRIADVPKSEKADKTSFVARQVVKDVMRGLGSNEGPYFRIMSGPLEGQRIEIADAQELLVGRDDGCEILLRDDDLISRRHAKIRRDWSGTHVEDLKSRNGIKVNRKRVVRKTLRDRDELQIGGTRLLYLDPSEVREAPVVLPSDEEDEAEHTVPPEPEPEPEQPDDPEPSASASQAAAEEEEAAEEGGEGDDEAPEPSMGEGSQADDGEELQDEEDEDGPPPDGLYARFPALWALRGSPHLIPMAAMIGLSVVVILVFILLLVGA
jgi:pSer/pThr/pTyr-binding forkhead associated (FHA) protein